MQKKDIIKIKFNFYAFHSQALSNILTKIIKKVKVMQIKTSGPVFLPTTPVSSIALDVSSGLNKFLPNLFMSGQSWLNSGCEK